MFKSYFDFMWSDFIREMNRKEPKRSKGKPPNMPAEAAKRILRTKILKKHTALRNVNGIFVTALPTANTAVQIATGLVRQSGIRFIIVMKDERQAKMNEEGMKFRMNENGAFEEYKEPYCVIECPEKEDYDHIVEMVEKGEKMRWIPVSERLPEADMFVLVVVNGIYKNIQFKGAIEMAEHTDEGWILEAYPEWENPNVTHWMPLPDAPEVSS